jgi:hypothetical protein
MQHANNPSKISAIIIAFKMNYQTTILEPVPTKVTLALLVSSLESCPFIATPTVTISVA